MVEDGNRLRMARAKLAGAVEVRYAAGLVRAHADPLAKCLSDGTVIRRAGSPPGPDAEEHQEGAARDRHVGNVEHAGPQASHAQEQEIAYEAEEDAVQQIADAAAHH